ncbi:MAG: hypothetical protein RLY50_808 [Actinomycetota bacterium]
MPKDEIEPDDIDSTEEEMDDGELDLEADDLLDDDDELIDGDDDDLLDDGADDDDGDEEEDDDDDDLDTPSSRPTSRRGDDDDDEDDMVAPDDVEEDLAEILKDRLASEETDPDDEVVEVEERSSGDDALQPKRADEVLCSSCFLLVRQGAPTCPVGDDACPVFAR